jgi:hypothetical protein
LCSGGCLERKFMVVSVVGLRYIHMSMWDGFLVFVRYR